jgi:hypothetical protein
MENNFKMPAIVSRIMYWKAKKMMILLYREEYHRVPGVE